LIEKTKTEQKKAVEKIEKELESEKLREVDKIKAGVYVSLGSGGDSLTNFDVGLDKNYL